MRHMKLVASMFAAASLCSLTGCSSSRNVEVSGEVSAALAGDSKILLEFFDLTGEGDSLERSSVHTAELPAAGPFKETISVEGDKIAVRAIADADGDGKCSAGEAWAEQQAEISADDKVEPVTLQLARLACPAD
jgi:hypothetical protein